MSRWMDSKVLLLLSIGLLALGVAACDDEDEDGGTTDTGTDTAADTAGDTGTDPAVDTTPDVVPDTQVDTTPDTTPDTTADATEDTTEDTGTTGACVDFVAGLGGDLGDAIGVAVQSCGREACIDCAFAGGSGEDCGAGGTMDSCISACIESEECGTSDASDEACVAVNDALEAAELDLDCLSCYVGITSCVVAGSLATSCAAVCANPSCECDTCQCDHDCPDEFGECSGLAALLDVEGCETDPNDANECNYGSTNYCDEIEALCAE